MNTGPLQWTSQLKVAPAASSKRLNGDKITLPQSALEALLSAAPVVEVQDKTQRNQTSSFDPFNPYSFAAERQAREAYIDRQAQLPHPLTFRLVNPQNGRIVYAGIREFSAEDGEVGLSPMLRESLGLATISDVPTRDATPDPDVEMLETGDAKSTMLGVSYCSLPKGTHLMLRPLEPGYDPEDWKSLLERYIRENMTTLTAGEILIVDAGRNERYRFLVDKVDPEGEAICVVDTDLEVDIQAMNEEQARETLKRKLAKAKHHSSQVTHGSTGGTINIDEEIQGTVSIGEYIDYSLKSWDRSSDLTVKLSTDSEHDVDVFVNTHSNHLRSQPRLEEHVFGDVSSRPTKRLKLSHSNVDIESAEQIKISVHAYKTTSVVDEGITPDKFTLLVTQRKDDSLEQEGITAAELGSEEVICKNCKQHIPKRTTALHEAFCYRNNIACPKCNNVFLKASEAWNSHWHCSHDDAYGSGTHSMTKHNDIFHPIATVLCTACEDFEAFNIPILAQHRVSTCPAKEILCQFCHLIVPQQGPDDPGFTDAEVLLSGMTPHEYADGARTTECHVCSRIIRLRDMGVHMRLHDRERIGKTAPRLCRNAICGRTIKSGDEFRVSHEQLGLCNDCFGPLYITQHDPEGKALRRRIERRLLQQLMTGCGKSWCQNADWCRTGLRNGNGEDRVVTTKAALPQIKPILEQLAAGKDTSIRFCVDESAQRRRAIAEMVAAESVYDMAWIVKSLEEEHNNLGKARGWLQDRAPKIGEVPT